MREVPEGVDGEAAGREAISAMIDCLDIEVRWLSLVFDDGIDEQADSKFNVPLSAGDLNHA